MSIRPLFASAPRIKLRIDNNLVAYAIGFNINVSVEVQPVFVLGQFAPVSIEPTMYNVVTGTLQIVRLFSTSHGNTTAKTDQAYKSDPFGQGTANQTAKANNLSDDEKTDGPAGATNNPLSQAELFKHVTPSQLLLSKSFLVELFMKVPTDTNATGLTEVSFMTVEDCRFTSRNTNISMGQLVNEPMNFQGLLARNANSDYLLDGKIKQT
jgi:hypothetical protein